MFPLVFHLQSSSTADPSYTSVHQYPRRLYTNNGHHNPMVGVGTASFWIHFMRSFCRSINSPVYDCFDFFGFERRVNSPCLLGLMGVLCDGGVLANQRKSSYTITLPLFVAGSIVYSLNHFSDERSIRRTTCVWKVPPHDMISDAVLDLM